MRITWPGTATLLIESGQTRILVDPYLQPLGENRAAVRESLKTDVRGILITHPHFDHFHGLNRVLSICGGYSSEKSHKIPVYVCGRGMETARRCPYPVEQMHEVHPGDELDFEDLLVRVYQGKHVKFDPGTVLGAAARAVRNRQAGQLLHLVRLNHFFSMGEKDIFIYEILEKASGKRAVVLGSAGDYMPSEILKGADVLVFPYAGRSDMAVYAERVIRTFAPKRVLYDHYDDAFPPFTKMEPAMPKGCRQIEI